MKKNLFLLLAILVNLPCFSQIIINQPRYGARTSALNEITKVELTDTSTNLYFKVRFKPGFYLEISDKSYIRPSEGNEKLYMKSASGIPVKFYEKWTMPSSGEVTYSMSYPKIDPSTEKIDFIDEGVRGSWNIFDIELKPVNIKSVIPDYLIGNWLKTDGSNQWIAGFFNNIAIYDENFWDYSNIQLKGKTIEITLKRVQVVKKLLVVTGKKGIYKIGENENELVNCSQKKTYNKKYKAPDKSIFATPFIKNDTAVYKGYICGYSQKLGYKTGMIYVNDVFTGKQNSYIITIEPNGTFETKIPLHHPIDAYVSLSHVYQQVFLEPGKTTMQFINLVEYLSFYTDITEPENRGEKFLFMGSNALINEYTLATNNINYYYSEMQKVIPAWVKIKRSGNEFTSYYSSTGSAWFQVGNSITIPMSTNVYIGFCITSHNDGALCKANLSDVSLNMTTPDLVSWKGSDIGKVAASGSFKISKGIVSAAGSGDDIWNEADAFYYMYQPISGDCEIIAKVISLTNTSEWAKAGVMIRESLDAGSKHAMAVVTPSYGVAFQSRPETNSQSQGINAQVNRILGMSPEQYKTFVLDIKKQEDKALADYQNKNPLTPKALQVIQQGINVNMATHLHEYNMNREFAFRELNKTENGQKKELLEPSRFDTSYFDVVTPILNNPLSLLNSYYYFLINRVKYTDAIERKHPTFSLSDITDLLEKDSVVFTAEEKEWIELAKKYKQDAPEIKDSAVSKAIYEKYKNVIETFNKKYSQKIQKAIGSLSGKDSRLENVSKFFGCNEMVMNIMKAQDYAHILESNFIPFTEQELTDIKNNIKDTIIANIIIEENNKLKAKIEENKQKTGFVVNATPKAEGDKLFDAMIEKFRGKVVYVDFWATWCGPCRSGISRIAPLKEEMKNDSVVFVYITGETSPLKTWENSIPDIKGEHFRVSADEWNMLCNKFNISGIPHYVLINKKGEVVNPAVQHLDNESLKQLLKQHLKE